MFKDNKSAFTLIELLIGLTILGIIASIAFPSYRTFVTRSYLNEAFDSLAVFRVAMEQTYQDNTNYGAGGCTVAAPTSPSFNYGCALGGGGQTYTATATGNGTNGITGYVYTINDIGTRITTAFPSATVPANCWLTTTTC